MAFFLIYDVVEKNLKLFMVIVLCQFPVGGLAISLVRDSCIIFASGIILLLLFPQPRNLYAVQRAG